MSKRKTDKDFREEIDQLVGEEYTFLESYTNNSQKIKCQHNKCGHQWKVRPNSFLQGSRCPRCAGVKKKTNEEFMEEIKEMVGDKYTFLEEYKSAHKKILCKHNKCGHEWKITPTAFLKGRRCPVCYQIEPNMYEKIKNYLDVKKIDYDIEYWVETSDGNTKMRFDFAVFNNNTLFILIEYDGVHHFEPFEFFGGKKGLRKTRKIDRIKSAYCNKNNIPLLRISYFKREIFEDLIDNMLEKVNQEREEINA